jgi:hypothetical protein
VYMYVFVGNFWLFVFLFNKYHDEVANRAFILELGRWKKLLQCAQVISYCTQRSWITRQHTVGTFCRTYSTSPATGVILPPEHTYNIPAFKTYLPALQNIP